MFLWIWNVRNLGTPKQIVDRLKSLHCKDVCIKYHDGSAPINFRDDFLEYLPVLKAEGISVGAWGYNYFNYPDAEASLIKEALSKGADYYIFDGEGEIEGKASQTESVLQQVRVIYPNVILGYAPFPYVKYHLSYPYKIFDKYCNFASPQSYSVTIGTSLDNCLKNTMQYFKEIGLKLPIYPSIESYKVEDYSAIKVFDNYGLWVLDSMDAACETFLKGQGNLVEKYLAKPVQLQSKVNEGIRQLQSNLNLLHIDSLTTDGIQGALTTAAIKKFQTIMGLVINGIVGPQTQNAINRILSRITIFPGDEDVAISYVQWRTDNPIIDSKYGPQTGKFIKKFQAIHGLKIDGIVGPKTWAFLLA